MKAKLEFVPNELQGFILLGPLVLCSAHIALRILVSSITTDPIETMVGNWYKTSTLTLPTRRPCQPCGQSALYNYAGKYANVKSEMAASFIHEIIAREAGLSNPGETTLTETLKELFETFFPDKTFSGPAATTAGTLAFDVELSNGSIQSSTTSTTNSVK